MDVPTLIREIRALPPADLRTVVDAVEDLLEPTEQDFVVPEWHRELLAERLRELDANPNQGESWDIVRKRLGWDE